MAAQNEGVGLETVCCRGQASPPIRGSWNVEEREKAKKSARSGLYRQEVKRWRKMKKNESNEMRRIDRTTDEIAHALWQECMWLNSTANPTCPRTSPYSQIDLICSGFHYISPPPKEVVEYLSNTPTKKTKKEDGGERNRYYKRIFEEEWDDSEEDSVMRNYEEWTIVRFLNTTIPGQYTNPSVSGWESQHEPMYWVEMGEDCHILQVSITLWVELGEDTTDSKSQGVRIRQHTTTEWCADRILSGGWL